jgi:hypothetical protein
MRLQKNSSRAEREITGETSNLTHIAPAREQLQAAVITAGKTAAGIELMPT